jgi:MvaI/BcnI restriction endonuclease family
VNLDDIQRLFADAGCTRLYAKLLADNDNSKNQIYFGPDFKALNLFPNEGIIAADSGRSGSIFKAKLEFAWLFENGSVVPAPGAQLILYPQYPEVRFSGFLRGCRLAPSALMRTRQKGRVLFLGVAEGQILGCVVSPTSLVAREFQARFPQPTIGVFNELALPRILSETAARVALLQELRRIHRKGWIESKQLDNKGLLLPCNAPQCGGLTLEAELGIPKNSRSEPDFHGWEIKQHNVLSPERLESGVITLMTPEPTGGYYKEEGVPAFIQRFGYPDKRGRPDRFNFGGIHKVGVQQKSTRLTIKLLGYDTFKQRIMDANGSVQLINESGFVAASWGFTGLLKHWTRKHEKAVYVPSECKKEPERKYRYGPKVRLGMRTDFLLFLKAMSEGAIYYDPGIKLEASKHGAVVKRRSQFRVSSRNIPRLYETVEVVSLS